MITAVFHCRFMVGSVESKKSEEEKMFESRENKAVGAAISCSAVCVRDVMNKVSICGKRVRYVTNQPFPALHC